MLLDPTIPPQPDLKQSDGVGLWHLLFCVNNSGINLKNITGPQ